MRIAVVGAGFAGLMYALAFARRGYSVEVFEEHKRVGYPPHCTGIVSSRTVELIGGPARESIEGAYRELLVGSDGVYARVKPRSLVFKLDRVKLESLMLEEVEALGSRVRLGSRVSMVTPNGKVAAGGSSRSYDAVILADGAYGRLHGLLNIGYRGSKLLGLNAVAEIKGELDRIVVDFSSRLSDGFFSWIVPVGGEAVIGTAARDPRALKPKMHILARSIGVKGFKRLYGGPVLTGPPAELLWRGRVFVVGDAGGLVKPLTGGGLYPNSVAASMATAIADKEGDPAKALREALCTVGRELRAQHYIARLFLSDKRVAGRAAALARIFKADRALSGSIDFDKHEDLPLAALSSPARMAGVAVGILLDSPRALKSLAGYVASLARSRLAPCKLH